MKVQLGVRFHEALGLKSGEHDSLMLPTGTGPLFLSVHSYCVTCCLPCFHVAALLHEIVTAVAALEHVQQHRRQRSRSTRGSRTFSPAPWEESEARQESH